MSRLKPKLKTARFIQGLAAGGLCTVCVLYFASFYGIINLDYTGDVPFLLWLHWCRENMGLSLIAFGICAFLYCICLVRLNEMLNRKNPHINEAETLENKLDLLINLFFGIGVIWTAIGIRNALLVSLSGLDVSTAQRMGAFVILKRLIDGGMLLALSTTIFGGIGGYVMRIIKIWILGSKLSALYESYEKQNMAQIIDRLDSIKTLLKNRCETSSQNTDESDFREKAN